MVKPVFLAECDICGVTEKAKPVAGQYSETYDPKARYWTKRPEEGQMAGMAWEDGA